MSENSKSRRRRASLTRKMTAPDGYTHRRRKGGPRLQAARDMMMAKPHLRTQLLEEANQELTIVQEQLRMFRGAIKRPRCKGGKGSFARAIMAPGQDLSELRDDLASTIAYLRGHLPIEAFDLT